MFLSCPAVKVRQVFFAMKELFDFIKALRDSKRSAGIAPDFVEYPELSKFGRDMSDVRDDIHRLCEKGVLKLHQGINYELVEILKEEI